MKPFISFDATAVPFDQANVDTDVIIPINRLIEYRQGELGPFCFEPVRYLADGAPDPAFPLNSQRYADAGILVAGENFGCGSSREAAVWALSDLGVRCIIAPSFGDIFYSNCFQNGLLPIRLPKEQVNNLMSQLAALPPRMTVDLQEQRITAPDGSILPFEIDAGRRYGLLNGLDEVGLTLLDSNTINAFQAKDRLKRPWVYEALEGAKMKELLVLAGDGIGPEIMEQVKRVVKWFAQQRAVQLKLTEELYGIDAWKAHGSLMRDETWQKVVAADAILFGATGSPEYDKIPYEHRKQDHLLRMRQELDLFTNLRPVKAYSSLHAASTLRPEVLAGTDIVIVRELVGGLYFGEPRGISELPAGGRRAVNTLVYTTMEVERIARAAFELARTRSGKVCSVDKSNVLETGLLWRETVQSLRDAEYPDVDLSHMYVDNCAMQLVRAPGHFDVIVTENLFGDILSDCAAMVTGSLGMMPSVSMGAPNAAGRRHALYEPIHGSAPDIAGKGIANPIGAILSFGLCLRHTFSQPQEADLLEQAVEAAVAADRRTADIVTSGTPALSTVEMGDAILAELERLNPGRSSSVRT